MIKAPIRSKIENKRIIIRLKHSFVDTFGSLELKEKHALLFTCEDGINVYPYDNIENIEWY